MTTSNHVQTQTVEEVLDTLLEASRGFDSRKRDHSVKAREISWVGGNISVDTPTLFGTSRTVYGWSEHAFQQMLGRLSPALHGKNGKTMGFADAWQLSQQWGDLWQPIGNRLLAGYDNGLLIRTYESDVRAFLTSRYGILDNTGVLEAMQQVLADDPSSGGFRAARSSIDQNTMYVRILMREGLGDGNLPKKERGNWGIGAIISNGEIGNRSLSVQPILQRGSCENSTIIREGYKVRHVGSGSAMLAQLKMGLIESFALGAERLEKIAEAAYRELPSFAEMLTGIAAERNWATGSVNQMMIGSEGEATVLGVINGVTWLSHAQDADTAYETQLFASDLLDITQPQINAYVERGKRVLRDR